MWRNFGCDFGGSGKDKASTFGTITAINSGMNGAGSGLRVGTAPFRLLLMRNRRKTRSDAPVNPAGV
jgi:hypothetical protein